MRPAREIDLVFFRGCAHAASVRARLREALGSIGAPAEWREWDTSDAAVPARFLGYASPTVFLNGEVVGEVVVGERFACALAGGPSIEVLRSAFARDGR